MYKLVETAQEREKFNALYKESFAEKNYELDEYYKGERYSFLVTNKFGEYAGTIEFVPYKPHSKESTLIDHKMFLNYEEILENVETTWEIDKVTVKAEDRKNRTLDNIIHSIKEITEMNGVTHLIGEMNPIFCRALKIEYKLNVIRTGGIVRTEAYPYIPTIIPIKAASKQYVEKFLKVEQVEV